MKKTKSIILFIILSVLLLGFSAYADGEELPVLKRIAVAGFQLTPSFDPSILEYTVHVNAQTAMLSVTANWHDNDVYDVKGADNLRTGMNNVTVKVTTPEGKTNSYLLKVIKPMGEENQADNKETEPKGKTYEENKGKERIAVIIILCAAALLMAGYGALYYYLTKR